MAPPCHAVSVLRTCRTISRAMVTILMLVALPATVICGQDDQEARDVAKATDDLQQAKQECEAAKGALTQAEQECTAARNALKQAQEVIPVASRQVEEAQRDLEAMEDVISLLSATLLDIDNEIRQLEAPEVTGKEAELAALKRRHAGLSKVLERSKAEAVKAAALLKERQQAMTRAEQARQEAMTAVIAQEAAVATATEALGGASQRLAGAQLALARLKAAQVPPHLQEVTVTLDGRTVYQARWEIDFSIEQQMLEHLGWLETELEEMRYRNIGLHQDMDRYGNELRKDFPRRSGLTSRICDQFDAMVWLIWQAVADGHSSRNAGMQTISTAEYKEATNTFVRGFGGLWDHFADPRVDRTAASKRIARNLMQAIDKDLSSWTGWPHVNTYQWDQARDHPPTLLRAQRALREAAYCIEGFPDRLDDQEAYRVTRKALEQVLPNETTYDLVGANYGHKQRLPKVTYIALFSRASDEEKMLAKLWPEHRKAAENLRAHLPYATVRKLRVLTDERLPIVPGTDGTISLTFSVELSGPPQVTFSGTSGEGTGPTATVKKMSGSGRRWSGSFAAIGLQPFAEDKRGIQIRVVAASKAGKALDADPVTPAAVTVEGEWVSWEEFRYGRVGGGKGGPDLWHVMGSDPHAGTSVCFLLDASNSMAQDNRITHAKAAIQDAIVGMDTDDEVALWVIFSCERIELVQPFTRDKRQLIEALKSVRPDAGTPLAEGIRQSGNYTLRHCAYDNKALVILTDGEETCGGDPHAAAAEMRRRVRVVGYGAGGPPEAPDTSPPVEEKPVQPLPGPKRPPVVPPPQRPEAPPREPAPEPVDETPPVKVQPADRQAYQVNQSGDPQVPRIELVVTRFREWGRDGTCRVHVTEKRFYVAYSVDADASGDRDHTWGLNPPFARRTLDGATSDQGQAAMDAVRQRWKTLPGQDRSQAKSEIEAIVRALAEAHKERARLKEGG